RPRGMAATVVPPLHRPARAPHLDPRVARLAVRRRWPRRSCRVVARPGCRPEALSRVPARSLRGPPADAASARRGYGHYPRSAAALVGLPIVWYYYAPLALPQILVLLRSASLRRTTLLAVGAMSFVLPLVNVVVPWCGRTAPPMAVLLAVQPAGFLVLLALSVVHHVT